MKNRIIWIDWAKVIGIMIVVYCHIPQDNNFIKSFFYAFQMPLFFMLAGYVHKRTQQTFLERIKKYWKSLIIPYLLFQAIYYPYWLVQKQIQEGLILTDFKSSVVTPIIHCFCGIPIDGPTWFIVALLITKLIADIAFISRFSTYIIGLLCSISIVCAYIIWQDDILNISFTIDSLFNFFPFFFIGYYLKTNKIIKVEESWKTIVKASIFFMISVLLTFFHNGSYSFHRISFYILGLSGSLFIINICKLLKNYPDFIQTISVGTIIILGLHWMFIGTTNFIIEKVFSIEGGIHYTCFQAAILVILITIANYIIIKFCQKHFKSLLGYR